jgi:hypothetical protein
MSDAVLVKTMASLVNSAGSRNPEPYFTELEKYSFDACDTELHRREILYLYAKDHKDGFTSDTTCCAERKW